MPVAKRVRFSTAKRLVSMFIAINRRISPRENWRRVSLVIANIAAPFLDSVVLLTSAGNPGIREKALKWPLQDGLKAEHLACGISLALSRHRLNVAAFCRNEVENRRDEHCTSVLYEWRFKCKSRIAGTRESRIHHATYRGEGVQGANRFGAYEFRDDHRLRGYRWFAGGCIRLGCRHVDYGEASGPPRLVGKADCATREALYSDFIGESSRLLVDAMQHNSSDLQKMLPVCALASRIRLSSSEPVMREAERVIRAIVSTYPKANLTAEQIEARAGTGNDPLRAFSDIRRIELESLQRQM